MKRRNTYNKYYVGNLLYYALTIDLTILHVLSAIASEQTIVYYMATNPNAIVRFYPSDMILNLLSDASYLSAGQGRSRAGGYFFLGSIPRDNQDIQLNSNIHITYTILKLVAVSAAEAELGALFLNTQEARIIRLTLLVMGHPQPPRPVHVNR